MNHVIQHRRSSFSLWTAFLSVAALLMAVAVFTVTQSVKQHEARVRNLNNKILSEQQAMRILDAEWAYLTRPQRLEELMAFKANGGEVAPEAVEPAAGKVEEVAKVETPKTEPAKAAPVKEEVAKVEEEPKVEAPKPVVVAKVEAPKKETLVKVAAPKMAQAKATPTKQTQISNKEDLVWQIKRPAQAQQTVQPTFVSQRAPAQRAVVAQNKYQKHAGIARPILE